MLLPHAENAIIETEKLRDSCLNPTHPRGKHKARVFEKALGFTRGDAEELSAVIKDRVLSCPCALGMKDAYGQRYTAAMTVARNGREAVILTAWILKVGEKAPRLTTCYVA